MDAIFLSFSLLMKREASSLFILLLICQLCCGACFQDLLEHLQEEEWNAINASSFSLLRYEC